ncbi:thermonuclease family protein [Mesorhizobium denitrificans]|uniref:Nuclease n=1 Tax=Mesorhizobium denitrificans TaxID=2294114 RepID=A0A371X6G8_9HYPH|nr:thermonuclease family protein [Mesorhizobium denitrificans]RFC64803.1 nuclease [Mesorhizobium denitrificans]
MKLLSSTAIVITLGALWPASAQTSADNTLPKQIYGRVQVLDGSTIEFIKSRKIVRFAGYLAPRLDQVAMTDDVGWPAGQVARAWLILRTLKHDVNCASVTTDANGTILAHCFVENTNLAAMAITEGIGYAFNFPAEPQVPAYFDIERRARGLGFGVWSDPKLSPPWNYKPDQPNIPEASSTSKEAPDPGLPLPPTAPVPPNNSPRG